MCNIAETRLIVEKAAAGLAAQRATEEQIRRLGENMDAQLSCVDSDDSFDSQLYIQLDDMFHRQILEASRNNRLFRVTEDMRSQWIRVGYTILQYDDNRHEIFKEHKAILDAIQAHDPAAAEQAMANHMSNTQQRHSSKELPLFD